MTPPAMENKLTHYWSDGTGRDTYIKVIILEKEIIK